MAVATLTEEKRAMDAQFIAQVLQSTDKARVAANILTQTLECCAQDMALDGPDVVTQYLRQGERSACARFWQSLTKHVAQALGALDEGIKAIYVPDNDTLVDDGSSHKGSPSIPSISLLVWRQHKTFAFGSLVAGLDRALVQTYRETFGAQALQTLLNVQVIDDRSFEKHFGSVRDKRAFVRPVAYWLTQNEMVDMVYARGMMLP